MVHLSKACMQHVVSAKSQVLVVPQSLHLCKGLSVGSLHNGGDEALIGGNSYGHINTAAWTNLLRLTVPKGIGTGHLL